MEFNYDIIVVGAGHAGCEAAAAAANLGSKTCLITMDMNKIGQMSCNPAMGGIAKGQIVREIDALGGQAGIVTDLSAIQFRMLNRSKGPAMWSPRSQNDRTKFISEWRRILENTENLHIWQDTVKKLILKDGIARGVITGLGVTFNAQAVILTNGTFLNGLMHIGNVQIQGGRVSEPASYGITEQLFDYGFVTGRMKTGTPVRIDGRSVDFSKLIEQEGEIDFHKMSYLPSVKRELQQVSCFIAHTNKEVHNTLKKGLEFSPLYNGTISSIGPRYCPSIETKIVNFSDKDQHQLFLEPEGLDTQEYYLNGFSSSLPLEVQYSALRKIRGFENVIIYRPGYAIEYDYFDPTQLYRTLETKLIRNLYLAGQINGTTGYEEAGAQGLMAGINAHLKISGDNDFTLARDESYIGVLIDDLVTKGVDEPYRMFTSRAEYRILLRQDNADERLTEMGYNIGLVKIDRIENYRIKNKFVSHFVNLIENTSVAPEEINPFLLNKGSSEIKQKMRLKSILQRPQVTLNELISLIPVFREFVSSITGSPEEIMESAEIKVKYEGYITREKIIADKLSRLEDLKIKDKFNYDEILSLSTEARQKLMKINPETIGQAKRISGVSPADINVLLVLMGR